MCSSGPRRIRFPSTAETRRNILEDIARLSDPYARPLDNGTVPVVTENYVAVVLQLTTLDTLMSIEKKLTEVLQRLDALVPG